jgi:hypothetical protein
MEISEFVGNVYRPQLSPSQITDTEAEACGHALIEAGYWQVETLPMPKVIATGQYLSFIKREVGDPTEIVGPLINEDGEIVRNGIGIWALKEVTIKD